MRVGILPVRATSMDGKRVVQPLPFGHARREAGSQFPPLFLIQFLGKRKLNFAVQPPVGSFVLVRRLPIGGEDTKRNLQHVKES